ncbi:TRAP transporter substrate-binding protein [Hydrogenophaga sp. MI9]|uniref:TRAP transporter substrate-binding protein n=1 Tax=Hydrogenophaga sp. MI9 TaxID=3453719 RepID=UPI003EED7D93
MKRLMLKTILAMASLAAFGAAQAEEKVIKFAVQNPKGHPIVMGVDKFAEIVNAKAAGKLKVVVHAGGTLGSDFAVISAMQGGTVEMGVMNSSIMAGTVKEMAVYDFPFMFASTKEADAIVDGAFGKKLHAKLEEKGMVGLGYFELGFRNITNGKRPLNKVEDIAGLKLRVIPTPINVDWVKALDANPTPLPFPEVYAALENKAIDGQENPFTVIEANKLYEVQKYLAITNHQYNPQSVVISKKFWDTLSADEKKLLQDATNEASKYQRQESRQQMGVALEKLKKGGMQVTEFSPAEISKFAAKMAPVYAKHGAALGEVVTELTNELSKLRK